MGWMFLQLDQPVENDELDVVVALFNDQINVALSSSLTRNRNVIRFTNEVVIVDGKKLV